ncbi:hypothetical protein KP003_20050 [Geomonas nitrogeniifigens]|uniref:hypothetical protein n=1 Tax=Geomonas diazotrophica TaxID=2843197 RepID=UPI001C2BA467|nr:hypothetical protein [Geomonas nitrogeniifigens]QXE86613.1 hypothetical protein KP003_20050 [Geomonas nitrogeniifigens]
MTRSTSTKDIDLCAAIMTATDRIPSILRQSGQALVSFEFKDNEETRAVIMAYATGELMQPVKRFAACRAWLYRQARGVKA